MSLRINDTAPDFEQDSTVGKIKFHDYLGDSWGILFSHPKDFTPVCTTELGYMAKLKPEFDKRNTKILGLSVDPVGNHEKWAKDIEETQGAKVNYPLIGDSDLRVAKAYDMLPAAAGNSSEGRTPADNATVRSVFIIGPGQEGEGDAHLSDEHRPQFRRGAAVAGFLPAHRQAHGRDAGQLEGGRGRDHPALGLRRPGQGEIPERLEGAEALSAHRAAAEVTAAAFGRF